MPSERKQYNEIENDSIKNAVNANGSWCWCWPHLNMQLKQCLQKPSQLMVRPQPYARYGRKLDIRSYDFGNNISAQRVPEPDPLPAISFDIRYVFRLENLLNIVEKVTGIN